MKKLKILFYLFVCVLLADKNSAQWLWQNPKPQGSNLYATCAVGENLLFVAGEGGIIMKTTDNGNNWEIKYLDTYETINKIWFTNDSDGYLSGNETFLKTTDGGLSWENVIDSIGYIYDFYFYNSAVGWLVEGSNLYNTKNGGLNWNIISNGAIKKIEFEDTLNGLAVYFDSIKKTTDGGLSWVNKIDITDINDIEYLTPNIIVAIGNNGKIFRSSNTGETWEQIFSPTTKALAGIRAMNWNNAWIVGEDGVILYTTDSGINWLPQTAFTSTGFYAVDFDINENGYIVGQMGKIFKTTNLGQDWINLSSGFYEKLKYVHFVSEEIGWCSSENAKIYRTLNGGMQWDEISNIPNTSINKIYFQNELIGWLAAAGVLYKSTNGGVSWNNIFVGIKDFEFIDVLNGYLISNNLLLKTSDGGDSWQTISSDFYDYDNLEFISLLNGWALDQSGKIRFTINGGINWSQEINLAISSPLSIFFINQNKGWIIGSEGKILKTIDGGVNWYLQNSGVLNGLTTIEFTDENNGVILTKPLNGENKIYILTTTNGGINWDKRIMQNLSRINLFKSHFENNLVGWIVGENGTILRTTNGGATFINDGIQFHKSNDYLLFPNYPNPFNSISIIKYTLSKSAQVTLKIFNTLGQEIETLVSEEKNIGNYEINWNATEMPSGVYFYQLRAGTFVETKKMLLLK